MSNFLSDPRLAQCRAVFGSFRWFFCWRKLRLKTSEIKLGGKLSVYVVPDLIDPPTCSVCPTAPAL